jgi:hypothetical protein
MLVFPSNFCFEQALEEPRLNFIFISGLGRLRKKPRTVGAAYSNGFVGFSLFRFLTRLGAESRLNRTGQIDLTLALVGLAAQTWKTCVVVVRET